MKQRSGLVIKAVIVSIMCISISALTGINADALNAAEQLRLNTDVDVFTDTVDVNSVPNGYMLNAFGELVSIEECIRENQAIIDTQNQQGESEWVMTESDEDALLEYVALSAEQQKFEFAIDTEAAGILKGYTGISIVPTPSELSQNWSNMRTMLDFLGSYSISYEEFDTVFRYFLRRWQLVDTYNPEFRAEIEVVIGPLAEFHSYEYIPNGLE